MLFELLMFVLTLLFFFNLYLGWNDNYWLKQDIPYIDRGNKLFGNIKDVILMKKTIGEVYADIYKRADTSKPVLGFFKLRTPILMVRDPDLVRQVLDGDFDDFMDNDVRVGREVDPMLKMNPFLARGAMWKLARRMMEPCQYPDKLKSMVDLMRPICRDMIQYIKEQTKIPIEVKDFSGRLTTDIMASCVFGMETNSFIDPQPQFRLMTKKLFEPNFKSNFALLSAFFAPWLSNIFKFRIIRKEEAEYFIGVVSNMCEYREREKLDRDDLLMHLININRESVNTGEGTVYNYKQMGGYCLSYLIDGYYKSATALCFSLYELAQHPECQTAARAEIKALNKRLEEYDVETIRKLLYLDMFVSEVLRLHPPIQNVTRVCTPKEGSEVTLKTGDKSFRVTAGTPVTVPILGLHMDPDHFDEPDNFSPERFSPPANEKAKKSYVYLPFGQGPRRCPGDQLAEIQLKMALVSILMNFVIEPRVPVNNLKLDPYQTFFRTPKGDLWLRFVPISYNDSLS